MTAGVAKARKSVIFRVEGDDASIAVGELGPEGSAQVISTSSDTEALALEEVGQDLVGVNFLVAELRILPDLRGGVIRHHAVLLGIPPRVAVGTDKPLC